MTQRDGMGREEGGGFRWGTHVYLWRIHVDIWQNQYNIVKLKNFLKKGKEKFYEDLSCKKKEDTDNMQNLKMEYKDRAEINKTEYYKKF